MLYGDERNEMVDFFKPRMAFLKDYSGLAVGEEFMGQS